MTAYHCTVSYRVLGVRHVATEAYLHPLGLVRALQQWRGLDALAVLALFEVVR